MIFSPFFITFQEDVEFEEVEMLWKKWHFAEQRRRVFYFCNCNKQPSFQENLSTGRRVQCLSGFD